MRDHNAQQGYEKDAPVACALQQIFESIGDTVGFGDDGDPAMITRVDHLAQVCRRATQ